MSYVQGEYPLIAKKNLAKNIYDFTIRAHHLAALAQPGQFVHLKVPGFSCGGPSPSVGSTGPRAPSAWCLKSAGRAPKPWSA